MITENGIVTSANADTAWIKTTRSGACEACSSKESCGTANNAKEVIVSVKNTLNVKNGDHVVIGLETKPMLYLTFFIYVFPILMMILGAVIGDTIAPYLKLNPSPAAMAVGFSFFGLSFYFIRKKNTALSKKDELKPFLVRKRPHAIQAGCSLP